MEMENQEKEIHGDHALSTQTFGEGGRSSNLESVLKDVGISSPASSGNRKKLMLGLAIILAVGAGIFYYMNREIKGSPDDYVITGDIIENKRAGLKIQAPQGWDIEKMEHKDGAGMFYSSDTEIEWRDGKMVFPIEKGCIIQAIITYDKMDFEKIKEEAKYTHFMLGRKFEEFEEITINNNQCLKNIFDTQDAGPGIAVYIPKNNKVYSFYLTWGINDKQRCVKEFEEMLDRAEIE